MQQYYQARFAIDSIPDQQYSGYSTGEDWNGFARPLFDYETAAKVLRDSEPNGFLWTYEPESDTFVVQYELQPDDDPEEFVGFVIAIGDVETKVYGIGAGSWIWEEVTED